MVGERVIQNLFQWYSERNRLLDDQFTKMSSTFDLTLPEFHRVDRMVRTGTYLDTALILPAFHILVRLTASEFALLLSYRAQYS